MSLADRINEKTARVGIIGMGYVGLPLAITIAEAGLKVTGIDLDKEKVAMINKGESYIPDVDQAAIKELVDTGRFDATADFSALARMDVISICVPTPLNEMHEPDISYVRAAATEIAKFLKQDQLVILESTTYPGTTEEVVLPMLEESGLTVGQGFYLAFSPERVDPGNKTYGIDNTPKVVGGVTEGCTEHARSFYSQFVKMVVPVSSTKAAEMTKLLENIFRCVNIALVNELMLLCDRMDINIWEVIEAAASKPFGFMPFLPGPGLGGHCIPIDPFYLSWKARQYDFHTEFIELAGKTNESIPYYVVSKVGEALNEHEKSIKGSNVLVLGLAYKKDIGDTRESPALKVISLLEKRGAHILYHDPYVDEQIIDTKTYTSVELTPDIVTKSDCVLVVTDHTEVDYNMVADNAKLIVDTRNKLKSLMGSHIVRI
ncbi:MAG: UDP-N-acetyl-D-glucosamine dehydrogenase [Candidatus Aquicultor secundus]|uniref:UDP-N-acetyl-D-glucosamine dehydrogenase n=1 Tax=Candidatus Aquicultor secundus TaxID=1973895 RepID=A0A2M7TAN9_9ACTN|nr:nucleotide sugar dehydrogenase [Candidatus Aquicultor secundus]NCO65768.1 nucleotide sugar dehydrogenase [Solirubrobacter sp.]OIO86100.1 MAG: UDP-N-acetyl-D-glucosamine dehydrogenase [Candidatus Aquicultor secundus]PIU26975.1 MAG: UDP-N-acetyl-D-glucosamine dehydrogenase [Candidatus Aquicultor secundus]PIW22326.1 MAG: UDP-N-acetyl-D-glucosamine dehydrogenase [Candidatus Aquicultor secundus]PIX51391.1 MAG: UDP-N-acetyl-D-glucosamine dehydrogenase [Candidatus Aquicultor secundus]